jgi:hypothetical protein
VIKQKAFTFGTRILLSELDILNLKRSDFVAFTLTNENKSRINLRYTTEKGAPREYMFYILSEIIDKYPIKSRKYKASVILNPATLSIEWLTILSLIEKDDELEIIWCLDHETSPILEQYHLHYDCVRLVIHKANNPNQYHIRLSTQVGDDSNRLIKIY